MVISGTWFRSLCRGQKVVDIVCIMPEAKDKAPEAAETSGDEATEGENATAIPAGSTIFFWGLGKRFSSVLHVVDQDVTPEAPNKLISKQKILDDFMN